MASRYWWFRGQSIADLRAALAGEAPVRLEVRIDKAKNMTLHVVPDISIAEGGGGGINDSHVCPPSCP